MPVKSPSELVNLFIKNRHFQADAKYQKYWTDAKNKQVITGGAPRPHIATLFVWKRSRFWRMYVFGTALHFLWKNPKLLTLLRKIIMASQILRAGSSFGNKSSLLLYFYELLVHKFEVNSLCDILSHLHWNSATSEKIMRKCRGIAL